MRDNGYIPTKKEQQILDLARERAIKNVENFEGIKSGIVREAALALLGDANTPKSKIAGLLIKNLSNNETQISNKLIYKVLRAPEFKATKDQLQMNRGLGKAKKTLASGSTGRTRSKLPNADCMNVVAQEIKKIRQENPKLSDKEIRAKLKTLEPIKQYSRNILSPVLTELIPIYHQDKEEVVAVVDNTKGTVLNYALNEQEIGANMIKRIEQFLPILEWLSGMDEPDRTTFYKHLPKGKAYSLALQEKCRDRIRNIVKMMLDRNLETFLKYTDEFAHLIKVFDEELYNEKLLREKRRDMASV